MNFIAIDGFSFVEFEAGFIRLLDKLTNGTRIEVNETGTVPQLAVGGNSLTSVTTTDLHSCTL